MTKIVLADDHPVVRQGLQALLSTQPDFSVVGETADGLEAVKLVEQLEPDVLVVDIMMPGLTGTEVIRQVQKRSPKTSVVVLSMYADEAYVLEALRNGASGYVLKDAESGELIQAIRKVVVGELYLSSPLSRRAIEMYIEKTGEVRGNIYEALTGREREVLHLAAEGLTSAEIADRLFISPRTVEAHRGNMMHKLDLQTQTDLIRYALKRGILPMEG